MVYIVPAPGLENSDGRRAALTVTVSCDSLLTTHYYSLLLTTTHYYSLLLTTTHSYSLLLTPTHYYFFSCVYLASFYPLAILVSLILAQAGAEQCVEVPYL